MKILESRFLSLSQKVPLLYNHPDSYLGASLAYSTNPGTCRISGSRLITPGEQQGETGMVFTMQVIITCSRILLLIFKIVLINIDIKD